jgi:5'-nucleotidase
VFPRNGRGGLALLGGYLNNLRAARAMDRGAVLLFDAGDAFLGTVESNLSEGALVIDAYNALGYTAASIGNHEFDFGAVDSPTTGLPENDDVQGAIKARARQARFPYVAANLLDDSTGRPVRWHNVAPSAIVDAAGVKVGIVGAMTAVALRATLAANTRGLRIAPLAPSIIAEALSLRSRGAQLVIVVAHAGGRCTRFDDPTDLSSCDASSEIFDVAGQLPAGLVDVIVAGHTHAGLAHRVNGIAIIEPFFQGRSFGRVDVVLNRATKRVLRTDLFAPRDVCASVDQQTQTCDGAPTESLVPASYEGKPVRADVAVEEAMAPALRRVRDMQSRSLGVILDTPIRRTGNPESGLNNLFADALRESVPGADMAINNNALGGLRTDLPPGPLTFGRFYDVFPFDNRVVRLSLSAAQLQRVITEEVLRLRPGALGISGLRVVAGCGPDGLEVKLVRASGENVQPTERLTVVTTDFLAAGQVFASVSPPGGYDLTVRAPIAREVVADWLRKRQGTHLLEREFVDPSKRRFEYPEIVTPGCQAQ